MRRHKQRTAGIAGHRRRNRIAGHFSAVQIETLESPAWQVLSLSGRRVLDRVRIELGRHAGHECSRLCVTYDDFERYGIHRHSIAPAIREVVALGFLRITRQGRAGNAEFRQPTYYQLTFINNTDGEPLTHEWRRFGSVEEARAAAQAARATIGKNRKPMVDSATGISGGECTTKRKTPVADFATNAKAKTTLRSISRVGGRAGPVVGVVPVGRASTPASTSTVSSSARPNSAPPSSVPRIPLTGIRRTRTAVHVHDSARTIPAPRPAAIKRVRL